MAPSGGLPPGTRGTVRDARALPGPAIRTVLVLGFALTAGIWLFAGSYFSDRIRDLESQAGEVSRRYVAAQELLNGTRNQVYRASIYVRDALITSHPADGEQTADVEAAYLTADRLLANYVPVLDSPSDRDRINRLRREVDELRVAMMDVLAVDRAQSHSDAGALLRVHMPRRDAAIRVADELQALNRTAYVAQQAETARLYRETQSRFGLTLGVAILASLGVALLAGIHVGKLEGTLREQQENDARTAAELQRLSARLVSAQEEERRTIARDLHDEIGQVLTVIKMELSHAQREIAAGKGGSALLDDARAITDRALQSVRDISHLLHPPLLDDLGLSAAVDWYVQSIRKRQDLVVEFTHQSMGARLPPDIEVALYRIVQEGLTNVLRHAKATTCRVSLTRFSDHVAVAIDDDGVGFDPGSQPGPETDSGLGLVGIRERVARLGGSLSLETAPGRGTILKVEFPIDLETHDVIVDSAPLAHPQAG